MILKPFAHTQTPSLRHASEPSLRPPPSLMENARDTFAGLIQSLGSMDDLLTANAATPEQGELNRSKLSEDLSKGYQKAKTERDEVSKDESDLGLIWVKQSALRCEPDDNKAQDRFGAPLLSENSDLIAMTSPVQAAEGLAALHSQRPQQIISEPHLSNGHKPWLAAELNCGQVGGLITEEAALTMAPVQDETTTYEVAGMAPADGRAQDLYDLVRPLSGSATTLQGLEAHASRKRRLGRFDTVDLSTSQPSQVQDDAAMPQIFGSGRPQPNLLSGSGRAANYLQVLVLTIQDRASIFVKLPALWDMARHQIRDLVAGRASALGVPVDRIEIASSRVGNSLNPTSKEDYHP